MPYPWFAADAYSVRLTMFRSQFFLPGRQDAKKIPRNTVPWVLPSCFRLVPLAFSCASRSLLWRWCTQLCTHMERVCVPFSRVWLCDPTDCDPPGSSLHGVIQARILEWVAMPSSRGIFPTQGSNPHLPPWQADSLPRSHLGSPSVDTAVRNDWQYLPVVKYGYYTRLARSGKDIFLEGCLSGALQLEGGSDHLFLKGSFSLMLFC